MPMLPLVLLVSFLAQPAPPAQCADWKSCRDLAEAAAARQDYESFHDLAWRTMRLRRTNDPDVMVMLARAQSLSGRPHDALVMLGRIVDMGVATDADTSPDLARVRALAGWPALLARLDALRSGESAAKTPEQPPAAPAAPPAALSQPAAAGADTLVKTHRPEWVDVARFQAPQFSPGGIAYDAVSRRYLVGNFPHRKLTEIEEGSNRPATLSGAAAQFFDVKALEIDTRQGDLWVVSDGTAEGGASASAVHKLQLISGRVLKVFDAPAAELPTRFVDVAVSNGGVLVLDAATPRIFTIAPSGSLQFAMSLPAGSPASIAPVNGSRSAYVAYSDRLVRVDVQRRTATPVTAAEGENVKGLERIRWHRDGLVGIQSSGDGVRRVVRLPVQRNGFVAAPEVLDQWRDTSHGAAAASLIGNDFYYLVPGDGEAVIRRIRLR